MTRQALEERVRPVLFINKVDRLINELKLSAEEIQEKFAHIIGNFNDLIEVYGEPLFKERWKVDPAKDSVAFGSALHGWGFTLNTAKSNNVKFGDIFEAYEDGDYGKLQKALPLHGAILDMVVKNTPSPPEAQKYRVEKIWKGDIASEIGGSMMNCDPNGTAVLCITNVQAEPDSGLIATGRLFSGTVGKGAKVYLVNAKADNVVEQVSIFMGAFREPAAQVEAGNILALSGLEQAKAGETVVGAEQEEGMVPFERVSYVSEPVVTVAIEPRNPLDLPLMLKAMERLSMEDPNLAAEADRETGEYRLSGMGELHLEVALKLLKEYASGIETIISLPRVVYRETVTRKSAVAEASSPNKQNRFSAQVEPLKEPFVRLTEQSGEARRAKNVLAVDEQHGNLLVDCTGRTDDVQAIADFVASGFEYACKAGPLCGEPLRHVKVNLMEIQVSSNPESRNSVEIMRGMGKAIFGAVLTAEPVLLEPVYRMVATVPAELAGACSKILGMRRGRVLAFEPKGASTIITAYIPVAETFGLSKELRSATSGRAFWQSIFDHWKRVPERLEARIIGETRKRKGLPSEIPKPEKFLEEN